jgi:hypothetical protein
MQQAAMARTGETGELVLRCADGGAAEIGISGDWYCEDHPEHLMAHDVCDGMGIIESARIPMLARLLKIAHQETREANQMRDDTIARVRAQAATCPKCTQSDAGQTGEYPCSNCGLPMVWDAALQGGDAEKSEAVACRGCKDGAEINKFGQHCYLNGVRIFCTNPPEPLAAPSTQGATP